MEKIEYQAPDMLVIEMKYNQALLDGSQTDPQGNDETPGTDTTIDF